MKNHLNGVFRIFVLKYHDLLAKNIRGQMEYGYKIMKYIVNNYKNQIKITMPKLIPIVSNDVNDVNPNVKKNCARSINTVSSM